MVNLQSPVVLKVNGKGVFDKKVTADKGLPVENADSTFDRKAPPFNLEQHNSMD